MATANKNIDRWIACIELFGLRDKAYDFPQICAEEIGFFAKETGKLFKEKEFCVAGNTSYVLHEDIDDLCNSITSLQHKVLSESPHQMSVIRAAIGPKTHSRIEYRDNTICMTEDMAAIKSLLGITKAICFVLDERVEDELISSIENRLFTNYFLREGNLDLQGKYDEIMYGVLAQKAIEATIDIWQSTAISSEKEGGFMIPFIVNLLTSEHAALKTRLKEGELDTEREGSLVNQLPLLRYIIESGFLGDLISHQGYRFVLLKALDFVFSGTVDTEDKDLSALISKARKSMLNRARVRRLLSKEKRREIPVDILSASSCRRYLESESSYHRRTRKEKKQGSGKETKNNQSGEHTF